jgi:hypothetical protein
MNASVSVGFHLDSPGGEPVVRAFGLQSDTTLVPDGGGACEPS